MKRTKPYYSIKTKKRAVQMVAAGLLTEEQACLKFKINCRLLRQWQQWYEHFFFHPQTTRTTYADHSYVRYKNLAENLEVTGINQRYVSDITYIPVGKHFACLNLVTDAYSRKIVGWKLHESLQAEGTIEALEMALQQKGAYPLSQPLVHHSDRGIQYCCYEHVRLLKKHEVLISMTNSPDPLENPLAERMNPTLKEEFKLERGFPTFELAQRAVARTIFIYNHRYPHGSVGYCTPD